MDLRDHNRVGLRTVEVIALVGSIVVQPVALQAVRHVVPVDVLGVHSVPAGWELDVDFQLSTSLNREEAMFFLLRRHIALTTILVLPLAVESPVTGAHSSRLLVLTQ